jgi:Ca2+-binding RTX toxin-like protein
VLGRCGIAAGCAVMVLPAGALAAMVGIEPQRIVYAAAAGEANDLSVSLDPAGYALVDAGAEVTPGPGCAASGGAATCPAAGIARIFVSAGDEADDVENLTPIPATISGGDGNDSLEGGSGADTLRGNKGIDTHAGGAGDDFIDSRGDTPDVISCGSGADTVRADAVDSVAADCEDVDRAGPAPPASGPSPTGVGLLGAPEARRLESGACFRERLGTPRGDRLTGTALGDSLFGLQGNDRLKGLPGDDCLFGGTGSDHLSGSKDDDRLVGDDSRRGVGGNDRLRGEAGNDMLVGGPGNDRLSGGAGRNRLFGGPGNDLVNGVNDRFDRIDCGRGRDTVRADNRDELRRCERVSRTHLRGG